MLGCKYAIPHMIAAGGGAIVTTSSTSGQFGDLSRAAYGVSKAGIDSLTRYVATLYGKQGIRANAVAPGVVKTPSLAANVTAEELALFERNHVTPGMGEPHHIAQVVAFLLSDARRVHHRPGRQRRRRHARCTRRCTPTSCRRRQRAVDFAGKPGVRRGAASARICFFEAANEQIGQAAKSWRSAGQYSRPKKMICRWRRFQVSIGNTAFRSRSVRSTVRAVGQAPPPGEPVDVGVDRERRHAERLRHHHARRLVADAGERLEELPVGQHLAAGVDDLVGGEPQVPRLGRGEPDLADDRQDPLRSERRPSAPACRRRRTAPA